MSEQGAIVDAVCRANPEYTTDNPRTTWMDNLLHGYPGALFKIFRWVGSMMCDFKSYVYNLRRKPRLHARDTAQDFVPDPRSGVPGARLYIHHNTTHTVCEADR